MSLLVRRTPPPRVADPISSIDIRTDSSGSACHMRLDVQSHSVKLTAVIGHYVVIDKDNLRELADTLGEIADQLEARA